MIYDYLIIGQGIAGSILAWKLIQRGKSVFVIDNDHRDSSTRVAAGLLNPITGKRFVLSWRFPEYFPVAKSFYREAEAALHKKFFQEKSIIRILQSEAETEKLVARLEDPDYKNYLSRVFKPNELSEKFHNEHGAVEIAQGGILNPGEFLTAITEFLITKNAYKKAQFKYEDLTFSSSKIAWENICAHNIIFCEGFYAIHNPLFSWLPFNPAKGEFLSVRAPLDNDHILNTKYSFIPNENGIFRVGATYAWDAFDNNPTEMARNEILEAVNKLFIEDHEIEIIDQRAGVRPCTRDSRPFLGVHPEHSHCFIFNGFGSKGTLLCPFFADQFLSFLLNRGEIEPEVSINRYIELYTKDHEAR